MHLPADPEPAVADDPESGYCALDRHGKAMHTGFVNSSMSRYLLTLAESSSTMGRQAANVFGIPVTAEPDMKRKALKAVYADGVLKPDEPLDLPDNSNVRITIEPADDAGGPETFEATKPTTPGRWVRAYVWLDLDEAPGVAAPAQAPAAPEQRKRSVLAGAMQWLRRREKWPAWLTRPSTLEWSLFSLAVCVYAVTRFHALDRFPIFFFGDEATNVLLADDLISRHFKSSAGGWLPVYFEAAAMRWTPLLSVYVHAITVGIFGKSIVVARETSAMVSLVGAGAVGLILRSVFGIRYWWAGVLLMAASPAWFLHSRTAFETVMMSSFYACFLLSYLLYRARSPRYLFITILFGAAAFYMYSTGQMVMGITALLLLFSDIRYHLQHWRISLLGFLLAALLSGPLIAFRISQPGAIQDHLRAVDSYWYQDIPAAQKMARLIRTYTLGLSPQYWFFPNEQDLTRHRMKGYGHLNTWMLPFFLLGVGLSISRIRSSPYRTILLVSLAAPAGAALVGVLVTRVLVFVVPAVILTALGLDWLLLRLKSWVPQWALFAATFLFLSFSSLSTLNHALREGPLWFRDYGLYGMQYGAKQLFVDTIPRYLERNSELRVTVSPVWANGCETFVRFFLNAEQQGRVQMAGLDSYLIDRQTIDPDDIHVLTSSEYELARTNPKLKVIEVDRVIPYPDDKPGFYVVRMTYSEDADSIFAADLEARHRLVDEVVVIGGEKVQVRHSILDMGSAREMFDGDRTTLARVMEVNPAIVELNFPQPRRLSSVKGDFGAMDMTWHVTLLNSASTNAVIYTATVRRWPQEPSLETVFDRGPAMTSTMRIEITDLRAKDNAKIHIRELALR